MPRGRGATSRSRAGRITAALVTMAGGALFWLGASCGSGDSQPGRLPRDSREDGLFHDFMDGKFDGAGHPIGATVFEAESDCRPTTGVAEAEGWAARAGRDGAGTLCRATLENLGSGVFTVNVRALVPARSSGDRATAVSIRVRESSGELVAKRDVGVAEFPSALTYQNIPVRFSRTSTAPVVVEVAWPGTRSVRLDYVEVFRSSRQLILSPPSGELAGDAVLEFELTDPPEGVSFRAACGDLDRTGLLETLLADGLATRTTTEFRTLVTVPAASLLQGCPLPTRLKVSAVTSGWTRETSRVTYRDAPPACTFAETGTRVLLTGFEPFPADSSSDNASEQAVAGFDAGALDGVTLMRLILPVEYDTAAAWVSDVAERCQPDVLIGFGQGRTAVDLETTAYNVKDTSEVAGGVPDNRGVIMGGEPIVPGGPETLSSGLPLSRILDRLRRAGIEAGFSDDPGRYICNSVFYTMVHVSQGTRRVAGFVHLPRIARVGEAARAELQTVVGVAVEESVALSRSR